MCVSVSVEQAGPGECPSWLRTDGARRASGSSSVDIWPFSAGGSFRRPRLAAGRGRARTAAPAGTTSVLSTLGGKPCATVIRTARKPETAARTISACAKYLQPLTVWWGRGVPGHHVHLHVELEAQNAVAKCLSLLETEALRVQISNSAEDALETMPYAALRKRWQRSCQILSRGTSRTLGDGHTC